MLGIFFMASTLVVVSFSCTGPIIGTLLVEAASKGERLGPAVGMFGFALALALPFTAFALFPSALKGLPKSGGWLNSIKVVLGFLELAFSLKFLSNVDLAYHWNWFDREIFLSLWIALGLLLGLYLIGKIRFSHDSETNYLSVPRFFISVIVFAFVIYMVPGLWGAPLKSISAFLPPPATQDFDLSRTPDGGATSSNTSLSSLPERKYAANYYRIKTKGLDSWYDYDQALQVSKILHKPVIIDFTGFNCVNCRKMETNVWSDPTVFRHLRDDFVLLQLVVDDKAALPSAEQYVSAYSGKKITTLGGKWSDVEASRFNANSQPLYVMLDSNGNLLKDKSGQDIQPSPADYDIASYNKFLESGIEAYKNSH
ncbi:MAG: thioredoxin family protein, partial [Bacteroidetes bacterium]|nr:thioredoxin family protein [Bacteroidota bacterium]